MADLSEEDERLATGWLQHTIARSDATFPAWDEFTMLSLKEEARTWSIVLELVARAPAEHLGAVGAGPLENLLHKFPTSSGPRAATLARTDLRFRAALERVWLSRSEVPPDIREQLVLATGGKLLFLD